MTSTPAEIEGKLTPAARDALGELVRDYRSELLVSAAESASRYGDIREIAVHDIITAVTKQEARVTFRLRRLKDRSARFYAALGLTTLIATLLLGLTDTGWLTEGGGLKDRPLVIMLGLSLITAVGLLLVYIPLREGALTTKLIQRQVAAPPGRSDAGSFLSVWREIEVALRATAAQALGETAAHAPLSSLLEQLAIKGPLTRDEGERLRLLLAVRNGVAHGEAGPKVLDELPRFQHQAEEILAKLSS